MLAVEISRHLIIILLLHPFVEIGDMGRIGANGAVTHLLIIEIIRKLGIAVQEKRRRQLMIREELAGLLLPTFVLRPEPIKRVIPHRDYFTHSRPYLPRINVVRSAVCHRAFFRQRRLAHTAQR